MISNRYYLKVAVGDYSQVGILKQFYLNQESTVVFCGMEAFKS